MDDVQFRQLLTYLGLSWPGYRKVRKGVKKRIRRHMRRLGCHDIDAYIKILAGNDRLLEESELLLTVPISRFFRDRRLWEFLGNSWLPEIIAFHRGHIHVWSAGCASGEEPYSLKIIWHQLQQRLGSLPALTLLATDRHPQNLERARRGIYTNSSLKEVAPALRSLYFNIQKGGKQFAIKGVLKENIVWQEHHLLSQPPPKKFNIIFLRNNVLTYCRREIQAKALESIVGMLMPGGLLIIGCHEALPMEIVLLSKLEPFAYVFRKDSA